VRLARENATAKRMRSLLMARVFKDNKPFTIAMRVKTYLRQERRKEIWSTMETVTECSNIPKPAL